MVTPFQTHRIYLLIAASRSSVPIQASTFPLGATASCAKVVQSFRFSLSLWWHKRPPCPQQSLVTTALFPQRFHPSGGGGRGAFLHSQSRREPSPKNGSSAEIPLGHASLVGQGCLDCRSSRDVGALSEKATSQSFEVGRPEM